jgi:transposase
LPGSATIDVIANEKENDSETRLALKDAVIARLTEELTQTKEEVTREKDKNGQLEAENWDLKRQNQVLRFGDQQRRLLSFNTNLDCFKSEHFPANHEASPLSATDSISASQNIDIYEKYDRLMEEHDRLMEEHDRLMEKFLLRGEHLESVLLKLKIANETIKDYHQTEGKPKANSTNSSLRPSSDINTPKNKDQNDENTNKGPNKRRIGGQFNHHPHLRSPLDEDEADQVIEHTLEEGCCCPKCGVKLERDPESDRGHELYVKPEVQTIRQLHKTLAYKCPKCGKKVKAKTPDKVAKMGLLDVGFIVDMLMDKMLGAMSLSKIKASLLFSYGIKVATSHVNKILKSAAAILRIPYLQLLKNTKNEKILYIDETSQQCKSKILYNWAFVGSNQIVFRISSREANNLREVLGDGYEGTIVCDCYAAYRSFAKKNPGVKLQICLAHLKRDLKYCADWDLNNEVHKFGEKGLKYINDIFHHYHIYKSITNKDSVEANEILFILKKIAKEFTEFCINAPTTADKSRGIASRFKNFSQYYFTFLDNPDVPPTNNIAEQVLRGPVCDRKICLATQSVEGNWCNEVLWTIYKTVCLNEGVDLKAYLTELITNYLDGKPLPSLVNLGETIPQEYTDWCKEDFKRLKQHKKEQAKIKKANEGVRPFEVKPIEPSPNSSPSPKAEEEKPKPPSKHKAEEEKPKSSPKHKPEEEKAKSSLANEKHKKVKPKSSLAKKKHKRVKTKSSLANKKHKKVKCKAKSVKKIRRKIIPSKSVKIKEKGQKSHSKTQIPSLSSQHKKTSEVDSKASLVNTLISSKKRTLKRIAAAPEPFKKGSGAALKGPIAPKEAPSRNSKAHKPRGSKAASRRCPAVKPSGNILSSIKPLT